MNKIFKILVSVLLIILVSVAIYSIIKTLDRKDISLIESETHTTEESISMFSENFDTKTAVASLSINEDDKLNISLQPNGNANISGTIDNFGEINLYLVDGIFYSCIRDKCVNAENDLVATVDTYLTEVQNAPEILSYAQAFFEVEEDGNKQASVDIIGAKIVLADDGSEIILDLDYPQVEIDLTFMDEGIEIPNIENKE